VLSTKAGDEELAIPKLQKGSSFPYVYLDATYLNVRENHQVTSKSVVIVPGAPAIRRCFQGAKAEVLAFAAFPSEHRRQIWSTNPVNRAVEQGTEATVPRRGHLPERGLGHPTRRCCPPRRPRRVGGGRAEVRLRSLYREALQRWG